MVISQDSVTSPFSSLPLQSFHPEQLQKFTLEGLRTEKIGYFDPPRVLSLLRKPSGTTFMAVDLGGSKVSIQEFSVHNKGLVQASKPVIYHNSAGNGYLSVLEEAATRANAENIPVGISFAGPVSGTKPLQGPNVQLLMHDLQEKYQGDFQQLFPTLRTVVNDGVAGLIAGTIEAQRAFPDTQNVVYIINGSGIGGAVFQNQQLFAIEPGHVEIIKELNVFGQTKPCGMFDARYVCVESVAGGRAGIESMWNKKNHTQMNGKEIYEQLMQRVPLAVNLYSHSAYVVGHIIMGVLRAFDIHDIQNTVIVCHGGVFHVDGYADQVKRILSKNMPLSPKLLFTFDFSRNACLDGAAYLAMGGMLTE